eukprot:TRINITY_DN19968_c0_g1_i1.p1 TRINITY_DN19968_c0_g1~~TRINITY_DN19968_c0_g1_i1.p1  ORF type:complete len:373 (-),score=71.14 TRINITY_DN19968_c0_g1_i1:154-1272(-)
MAVSGPGMTDCRHESPIQLSRLNADAMAYCATLTVSNLEQLHRTLDEHYCARTPLVDDLTYNIVSLMPQFQKITRTTFNIRELLKAPSQYVRGLSVGSLSDLRLILDCAWAAHKALAPDTVYDAVVAEMARKLTENTVLVANEVTHSQASEIKKFLDSRYLARSKVVEDSVYDLFIACAFPRGGGMNPCFLGDGMVLMADGSTKPVSEICQGDLIHTESGFRAVAAVVKSLPKPVTYPPGTTPATTVPVGATQLVFVNGVGLTPSHPILAPVGARSLAVQPNPTFALPKAVSDYEWVHPWEVSEVVIKTGVDCVYNFQLEGGPTVSDHSVIINGLIVCTLGKNVGERLCTQFPHMNAKYGQGYWDTTRSKLA